MGTATYVKICCPRCGEKDLNIIGDRDIGGAVASGMGVSVFAGTKAGVLAGASGLQQKIYWICKKCGRKFRNPDELTAEIEAYQKRAKGFKIVGIIMSVLMLVAAAGMLINVFLDSGCTIYFMYAGICIPSSEPKTRAERNYGRDAKNVAIWIQIK